MNFDDIKSLCGESTSSGRLMALDIGDSRIGIAVCDEMRMIASPQSVYKRRNISQDLGYINKLIIDEKITGVVIGLPLELSGVEGENCQSVRRFANKLYKKNNVPIYLQDERFSTSAVTRSLLESEMTREKRQSLDDKLSACYILQLVLDRCRNGIVV